MTTMIAPPPPAEPRGDVVPTLPAAAGSPRIVVDNGGYELLNLGDAAMLQVAVARLRARWPGARITVVSTASPDVLARHLPGVVPLSPEGRWLWLTRGNPFAPVSRRVPALRSTLRRVDRVLRRAAPGAMRPPTDRRLRRDGVDTAPMHAFLNELAAADLVIASGGGYLTDSFDELAAGILETLGMAARQGTPVALLGQGLGPVTKDNVAGPMRRLFPRLGLLAVREGGASVALARRMGVPAERMTVTGDDAIGPAYDSRPDALGDRIGVNLRTAWYAGVTDAAAAAVRDAVAALAGQTGAACVALPVSLHSGGEDAGAIDRLLPPGSPALAAPETVDELIRRVGTCRVVVTGSYHGGVFALSQGIPAVALASSAYYREKLNGLAEQFGGAALGGCTVIDMTRPDLAAAVAAEARRLWDAAPDLRPRLLDAARQQLDAGRAAYERLFALVDAKPRRGTAR